MYDTALELHAAKAGWAVSNDAPTKAAVAIALKLFILHLLSFFAVTVALYVDGFTSVSGVLTAMTVAVDAIPNAIRIVMIGSIDEIFLVHW